MPNLTDTQKTMFRTSEIQKLMATGLTLEEATAQYDATVGATAGTTGTVNPTDINAGVGNFNFMTGETGNDVTTAGTLPGSVSGNKKISDFKTQDEYVAYRVSQGDPANVAADMWREGQKDGTGSTTDPPKSPGANDSEYQKYLDEKKKKSGQFNPYTGGSITNSLYTLGRGLGAAKGTKGKMAAILGGGASAALSSASTILSGIGNQKVTDAATKYYREQQFSPDNKDYMPAKQYTNSPGGFEDGGMFKNFSIDIIDGVNSNKKYEESKKKMRLFDQGGEQEMSDEPQSMQQEMSEEPQGMQQENQEEETQQQPGQQEEQIKMMVAQALQQGQPTQMIIQNLIKKGMNPQMAQQVVSEVVQQMQSEKSGEQDQEEADQPEMKKGGKFKHRVGDHVKFRAEGKLVEGKIKKIENGQIFL